MERNPHKEIIEQLINRCQSIGRVVGCNSGYTNLLWDRLQGKSIGDMRVDELIMEIDVASAEYNILHSREHHEQKSIPG